MDRRTKDFYDREGRHARFSMALEDGMRVVGVTVKDDATACAALMASDVDDLIAWLQEARKEMS